MHRLANKVALVTGSSSGIGAAIVEKLVDEGLKVVGLARRVHRIKELAEKCKEKRGKLYAVKTDMTREEEILHAFEWTAKNVGPISILINNAGIGRKTTIINGDTDDWKKVLDTNVLGLTIASREAIKSMQSNNISGHIVNLNSILGHQVHPLPYQNVYPASKFAVTALTETLRQELVATGSAIKVSSISPGHVNTEIFQAAGLTKDEDLKALIENSPSLRAEDVADVVLFVLKTPPHVQVSEVIVKPVGENI
uniref:FOLD1 n=1 Tax=Colaphellus bowringi TaxID=561076 RepID=A0A8G0VJF8_9CUCU|nr:FOLD1 [Colaphellus bowringi]